MEAQRVVGPEVWLLLLGAVAVAIITCSPFPRGLLITEVMLLAGGMIARKSSKPRIQALGVAAITAGTIGVLMVAFPLLVPLALWPDF